MKKFKYNNMKIMLLLCFCIIFFIVTQKTREGHVRLFHNHDSLDDSTRYILRIFLFVCLLIGIYLAIYYPENE